MDQTLIDLIQKKQGRTGVSPAIDWDDRRDKYLAAVDNLYEQVEATFAARIAQGTVSTHRRAKQLTENFIGTYDIDDLILIIGGEQVRFSPRGRNIVGAAGRVDVLGETGEATLVVQPGSRWGYVQDRQPAMRIVPLDEPVLAEILASVMSE